MNIFERKLNIGFDINTGIIEQVKQSYTDIDRGKVFTINHIDLDNRIIEFLNTKNISIRHRELFYTPPGRFTSIHIDGSQFDTHSKLNWVIGASGSKMHWYSLKEHAEPKNYTTVIETKALFFNKEDCKCIWSTEVGFPSLVNVGGPHNVENITNEGRWCLSIVLWDNINSRRLEWHDAIRIFQQYIVS